MSMDPQTIEVPLRLDYTFVAGRAMSAFLRGVAEGKLYARTCPRCERTYAPTPSSCSRCLEPLGDPFELAGTGVLDTFCIVNFPFPGQEVDPPYVVGHVRLDGADTRVLHFVREIPAEEVEVGLQVEPVWRPPDERTTSLESIRYFRPRHA